jgi:prepilin-type N-terminal cleavage/methylation domain-containing protein
LFHCGSYTSPPPRHGKYMNQRGFSLLELAISLLIISAGIVTILPNLSQGARMSAQARGMVTAVQLARNLMNELQLEKKVKEDKGDGTFDDFEEYSYKYEIEPVKLEEILVDVNNEDNSKSLKGDLVVKRLYKVWVSVHWSAGIQEHSYEAHSFLYGQK